MLLLSQLSIAHWLDAQYFNTSYVVIKLFSGVFNALAGLDFNTSYVVIKLTKPILQLYQI